MLKEKIALITGATRGIGREIAIQLAKEGTHIAFNYAKNDGHAQELKTQLETYNVKVYMKKVDVSKNEEATAFVKEVISHFGTLDILVNNAGIKKDRPLAMMSYEEWQSVIDINLTGVYNITKAAVFQMIKKKRGQIINITSVSGMVGLAGQVNYSASKAGVIGFTKALAKEVAQYNIRVNAVAPGFIETDMIEDFKEKVSQDIPLKRCGEVKEVAELVKYLLNGGDSYMTGQVLCIDGGLSL